MPNDYLKGYLFCMQVTFARASTREKGLCSRQAKRARDNRVSCIQLCVLYTKYPIVARRAAFRPSASREQRYLAYNYVLRPLLYLLYKQMALLILLQQVNFLSL